MKPKNWGKMSQGQKYEDARYLLSTVRGQYIIGQALLVASTEMKKKEIEMREISNIEDMEMLMEVFSMAKVINSLNTGGE